MVRAGFLNDNEYRQYPLVPHAANTLNTELIADCGFIMGLDSEFDPEQHVVYLASVTQQNSAIRIEFRTTAPAAADYPLVFTRTATSEEWEEEYVETEPGQAPCAIEPMWEGYLVTGPVNPTFEQFNAGVTLAFNAEIAEVEPGRIQTLAKSYLRSISLGNYARITVPPRTCDDLIDVPGDLNRIIVNATCLRGHVKFEPGHHCVITQQDFNNTLVIATTKDTNPNDPLANELCENGGEIKLYPLEEKPALIEGEPATSKFYSGGLACDETISSINGLGGPAVRIVGGAGIKVLPVDPDNPHTLKVQIVENIITKNC